MSDKRRDRESYIIADDLYEGLHVPTLVERIVDEMMRCNLDEQDTIGSLLYAMKKRVTDD